MTRFYDSLDQIPGLFLIRKGWIRVVGEGQYSILTILDPFTGRMRRNLIDLISEVSEGKIYVDSYEKGPVIGGEYKGDILDKYA